MLDQLLKYRKLTVTVSALWLGLLALQSFNFLGEQPADRYLLLAVSPVVAYILVFGLLWLFVWPSLTALFANFFVLSAVFFMIAIPLSPILLGTVWEPYQLAAQGAWPGVGLAAVKAWHVKSRRSADA